MGCRPHSKCAVLKRLAFIALCHHYTAWMVAHQECWLASARKTGNLTAASAGLPYPVLSKPGDCEALPYTDSRPVMGWPGNTSSVAWKNSVSQSVQTHGCSTAVTRGGVS